MTGRQITHFAVYCKDVEVTGWLQEAEVGNILPKSLVGFFPVEPAPSPQVTPVNSFLSNSLVTDLEGLSLSDSVLSPAVSIFIL